MIMILKLKNYNRLYFNCDQEDVKSFSQPKNFSNFIFDKSKKSKLDFKDKNNILKNDKNELNNNNNNKNIINDNLKEEKKEEHKEVHKEDYIFHRKIPPPKKFMPPKKNK